MSAFEKALFDALLPVFEQAWKNVDQESASGETQSAAAQESAPAELKKAA